MDYIQLLQKIKEHVTGWFEAQGAPEFTYHNLSHTLAVVKAVREMTAYYKLNNQDAFIVETAAWFHDLAYQQDPRGHEQRSAEKAAVFLKNEGVEDRVLQAVQGCILATQLPQAPTGLLQQILCDADLSHLGAPDFAVKSKLLRKEEEARTRKEIRKGKWRTRTLQLLQSHHFFTDYCSTHLTPGVQEHIRQLQDKSGTHGENEKAVSLLQEQNPLAEPDPNKEKHKKKEFLEKGVETLFRISSTNNLRLSTMADSKAHIMITVNSLIITVLLSVLVKNMDKYGYLTLPVILLLAINLGTIFFSMLATRPHLPHGRFNQSEVEGKEVNLLFFGNYYRMSFEEYSGAISRVMEDQAFLYTSLKRDTYQQGIVLSKKYRMLQIAYSIFMYGLIVSVIAFFVVAQLH